MATDCRDYWKARKIKHRLKITLCHGELTNDQITFFFVYTEANSKTGFFYESPNQPALFLRTCVCMCVCAGILYKYDIPVGLPT